MKPNVLIVDDDSRKTEMLRQFLVGEGIPNENIAVTMDAAAARRLLHDRKFDVMLLDVLLPSREGGRPRGDVSVDLLRELVEDGTSPAPKHIVAITADERAMSENAQRFREMTTQILRVEVGASDWKYSLSVLIGRVSREKASVPPFDFDVCVLCALRIPEQAAIVETWGVTWQPEESLAKGVLVRTGALNIGGATLRIACAHAARSGVLPTFHLAQALMRRFHPRLLTMTGICGGVGDGIQVGDVVIAEKSWDWQSGKWNRRGQLLGEVDQKDASADLVAAARGVALEGIYTDYTATKPRQRPRIHVAPMVTGSAVVAHRAMHKLFTEQHRKVAAVDMECFGLYYAAYVEQEPSPKVLCIKAVSDLADKRKDDKYQPFCSYLSACVMRETLGRWLALNG